MLSRRLFTVLVPFVFMSGCVNLSTLQTGRTLKAGDGRVTVSGGYYTSPDINKALDTATSGTVSDLKMPYAELAYRRGITDTIEVGGRLTLIGTAELSGKYQLLGDKESLFALSAGLGLGYLSLSTGSGADKVTSNVIDISVPVVASIHPADFFALYMAPKYVFRAATGNSSGLMHLVGGGLGFQLGSGAGVIGEFSYMKDVSHPNFSLAQFAGGFFF